MKLITEVNEWVASIITRLIDLFYIPIVRRFITRMTLRYLFCGVGNYIVLDSAIYYIIYHYVVDCKMVEVGRFVVSPHVASLILVFPITFMVGFWLNRYVAFNATKRSVASQLWRYALTVAGSILLSYIALKLLVERADVWATPAKMLSSLITSIYSYLMARFFTFRDKIKHNKHYI